MVDEFNHKKIIYRGEQSMIILNNLKEIYSGNTYYFTVSVRNIVGKSLSSEKSEPLIIKTGKPCTPAAPILTQIDKGIVEIEWCSPVDNGEPIIDYIIVIFEESTFGERYITVNSNKLNYRVSNLKPHIKYHFAIKAKNSVGESPVSPFTSIILE
jgi:hypothetical protein